MSERYRMTHKMLSSDKYWRKTERNTLFPISYNMTGLHGLGTPGKLIQTQATRSAEAGKKKSSKDCGEMWWFKCRPEIWRSNSPRLYLFKIYFFNFIILNIGSAINRPNFFIMLRIQKKMDLICEWIELKYESSNIFESKKSGHTSYSKSLLYKPFRSDFKLSTY